MVFYGTNSCFSLPGLIMIFHGTNKQNDATLSVGICLLAFPFVFVFPALLAQRWRHRVRKDEVAHKRMTKAKYEYSNDTDDVELDTLEEEES